MHAPRLLITDVDRTLLTHDFTLLGRVVEALAAARAGGMTLVLATARSPEGVRPYCERLHAGGLAICFNGAWIGDVSQRLAWRDRRLPRHAALEVMDAAMRAGLRPMWFAGSAIYSLSEDPLIAREAAITGEPLEVANSLESLPDEPAKVMCIAATAAEREGFAQLRWRFTARLSVSNSHPRLLEIGPQGASKREAAEAVALQLGLDRHDCAAAGDAENDLEMLAWAGSAVTVANAIPEAKRLAAFVAPSCDEGGLADAVAWLTGGEQALSAECRTGGRNG
jgi:Cof subfamily protein (haloacid dehalogenase superfamily)